MELRAGNDGDDGGVVGGGDGGGDSGGSSCRVGEHRRLDRDLGHSLNRRGKRSELHVGGCGGDGGSRSGCQGGTWRKARARRTISGHSTNRRGYQGAHFRSDRRGHEWRNGRGAQPLQSLDERQWRKPNVIDKNYGALSDKFRILCWNVLADSLVDMSLYPGTPSKLLDWSFRAPRILKHLIRELNGSNKIHVDSRSAAVACLQEVDQDAFENLFLPTLQAHGMEGCFKRRTGEKRDGLAIFWRTHAFELVERKDVEFRRPGHAILDRDNVALLVMLRHKGCGRLLCVATTHLLFNPKRGDIKLAQLGLLSKSTRELLIRHVGAALVICGDFNLTPVSALYELITTGRLERMGDLSCKIISGQLMMMNNHPKFVSSGKHGSAGDYRGRYNFDKASRGGYTRGRRKDALKKQGVGDDVIAVHKDGEIDSIIKEFEKQQKAEVTKNNDGENMKGNDVGSENHNMGENESDDDSGINDKESGDCIENNADQESDVNNFGVIETGLESMRSAYSLGEPSDKHTGEPAFTTFHHNYQGVVDYIFYRGLKRCALLAPPKAFALRQAKGVPCTDWPSDHISLAADFSFLDGSSFLTGSPVQS